MTLYSFEIGTSYATMVNIESLTVPVTPPKPTYSPYSTVIELADGTKFGRGAPIASWHWDFLPRTMRNQLRVFCPYVSSKVFIRTYKKDDSGASVVYSCIMTWPVTDEEVQNAKMMDFTIKFTQLVGSTATGSMTLGTLTAVGTGTVVNNAAAGITLGTLTVVGTGTVA